MFKKILYILAGILIVGGIITTNIFISSNKKLKTEVDLLRGRELAYVSENNAIQEQNIVFKYTIEQLSYYQDSINKKLLDTSNELKIKKNQIKQLQYLLLETTKTDTIITRDTIFRDELFLDTTLTSKYYTLNLVLAYPNYIKITPTFIDELMLITSNEKVTVNPPSPVCFIRWFQKKQIIQTIDIVNSNPNVILKKTRFIEIIKL